MSHELKSKSINGDVFMYCTCMSFIRIPRSIQEIKEAVECFKIHKWAWDEEEKREKEEFNENKGNL